MGAHGVCPVSAMHDDNNASVIDRESFLRPLEGNFPDP